MTTSTLTSKGQITVPLAVRTALGLQTGDKVDFVADGAGFRIVPLRNDVRSLKGRFAGRADKPVSINDMNAAIADAAAGVGEK